MSMDRLTLLDVAKQTDPDGAPAVVAEILQQMNPILEDAPAFASNAPTGNRVTMRSALPQVGFSKVNQGSVRSKGATEQRTDTIGLVAGLSEVDSKLRKIVGEAAFSKARWLEDQGFLEAYSQLISSTMLYGDEKLNDAAFTGLIPRLSTLNVTDLTKSIVGKNSASTVGGSIVVVDWGERGAHLIYPPNTTAGLDVRDKGEMRVTDTDGNPMMAYVTAYDAAIGLSVRDPRHIGRLGNIDVTTGVDTNMLMLLGTASVSGLLDILAAMPPQNGMNRVAYCPQRIYAVFMKQALNKSNANITIREYLGKLTPYFWDVPVRRLDQASIVETVL